MLSYSNAKQFDHQNVVWVLQGLKEGTEWRIETPYSRRKPTTKVYRTAGVATPRQVGCVSAGEPAGGPAGLVVVVGKPA